MTRVPFPAELTTMPAFDRALARIRGVTDDQLRPQRFVRVTGGWYVVADQPLDLRSRCAALREALPEDVVFSDATAAALLDLPLPARAVGESLPVHVTLTPRAVIPQRRHVVVHQRALPPNQIRQLGDVRITTPERLFVDLAMSLSREDLAVLGDAMLNRDLVTTGDLADAVAGMNRRRGIRLARATVPLLDGRSQSPPETLVRIRLAQAGFPAEPQCAVYDERGQLIGHADLGYRAARVAVEYEGRHHAEGEQFDYDIDRYSRFAAAGWLVIRCGRRDLAAGSSELIARVRAALATRPAG
jgi:hypothetical protein